MKIIATINRVIDKPESSVKAIASVSIDGMFAVHGIKIIENEKGRFVNMPSTPYTDRNGDKQYQDIFHPIKKESREALNSIVLNAYDLKLQQIQNTELEIKGDTDEEQSEEADEEPEPDIAM